MNERQAFALRWLDRMTDPPEEGSLSYARGRRIVMALELEPDMRDAGFGSSSVRYLSVNGVANTLSALKRRGLADNDGGGCFVQNSWWITDEGRKAARALA